MITGMVTADREAIISLTVRGPGGHHRTIKAVIDTGFDGWLSLPPALVASLGLPWRRRGRAFLASGSESLFNIYEATFILDSRRLRIPIDEADMVPLVGMALLEGYELKAQIFAGGRVTLKSLRRRRGAS
jgi:clan AA aspartic protease